MRPADGATRFWESVFLTLTVLALLLRVVLPPGMMVAPTQGSVPLVICTGHGPLALADPASPKAPTHSPNEAPCPFAMAGVAAAAPTLALVSQPLALTVERSGAPASPDLAPGRGLAAPPPPSHAPPAILI